MMFSVQQKHKSAQYCVGVNIRSAVTQNCQQLLLALQFQWILADGSLTTSVRLFFSPYSFAINLVLHSRQIRADHQS